MTARLPLWLKLAYSAFVAVLVPVYLYQYGPTNFVYFCDVALLLTLAGVWLESSLLVSMPAVGILLPQLLWVVDFLAGLVGVRLTGLTDYMFDPRRPLFLRGLSLFHGWLPLLLLYLVWRLGYDRRALLRWTLLAWALMLISFFFLPPPSPDHGIRPVNVDYVWGLSDKAPQHWMPAWIWFAAELVVLPLLLFLPAHLLLARLGSRRSNRDAVRNAAPI
jgi:hypothetical protein